MIPPAQAGQQCVCLDEVQTGESYLDRSLCRSNEKPFSLNPSWPVSLSSLFPIRQHFHFQELGNHMLAGSEVDATAASDRQLQRG